MRRSSGVNNLCRGSTAELSRISSHPRASGVSQTTNADPELASLPPRSGDRQEVFSAASKPKIYRWTRSTHKRGETEKERDGSPALFLMQIDESQCDKCTVKEKTTKLCLSQLSPTTSGLIASLSHERRPDWWRPRAKEPKSSERVWGGGVMWNGAELDCHSSRLPSASFHWLQAPSLKMNPSHFARLLP